MTLNNEWKVEEVPLVLPTYGGNAANVIHLNKIEKKAPTFASSFMTTLRDSWFNWLLLLTPVSFTLHFLPTKDYYQYIYIDFVVSIFSIIPLARLVGFAADEQAKRMGRFGIIFKCTVGNLTEFIISIGAVHYCNLRLASSSLVGSLLSNLLLVLGLCLFTGGIRFSEQGFQKRNSASSIHLLFMSVIGILVPGGFHAGFSGSIDIAREAKDIISMSRGAAIVLICVYFASVYFSSYTHRHLYSETPQIPVAKKVFGLELLRRSSFPMSPLEPVKAPVWDEVDTEQEEEDMMEKVDHRSPRLTIGFTFTLLFILLNLLTFSAFFLILHTEHIVEEHPGLSNEWFGLILIPLVSNAAEQVSSIQNSFEENNEDAIAVAMGKSISMSLFIIPMVVLISWIMKAPLTLLFNPFESISLFLAVLVVSVTLSGTGRTTWLSGFLLLSTYMLIALAFWFYPAEFSPIEVAIKASGNCVAKIMKGAHGL